MPNVVFDASSLIGALLKENSLPERALLLARVHDTICLSPAVETEIREVAARPRFRKYLTPGRIEIFLDLLTARAASYLVLCVRLGYPLPGIHTIPEQITAKKKPYYDALEAADLALKNDGKVDVGALERLLGDYLSAQLVAVVEQATGGRLQ